MEFDHYTYPGDPNEEAEAFCLLFKNRVLEVASETIYWTLIDEADERDAYSYLQYGLEATVSYLDEVIALGMFVQKLRDRDYLAKKHKITNAADYQRIHWELEKAFIFKMRQLERFDFYIKPEVLAINSVRWIRLRWQDILDDVPTLDNVSGTDDLKISDIELGIVIKEVKAFRTRVLKEFLPSKDHVVTKYLKRFIYYGFELNNEFYREIYECFEYFRFIPDEIAASHIARPTGYVRESYIKQKVKRILDSYANAHKNISDKK